MQPPTERAGLSDFSAERRDGSVDNSLVSTSAGTGVALTVELAGRDDTDDIEDGVGVGTDTLTPENRDGVSEGVGESGDGVGVNVGETDGGRVADGVVTDGVVKDGVVTDGVVTDGVVAAGVETSDRGVARDTSFELAVVGLKNDVSKEVSRGSGIASD